LNTQALLLFGYLVGDQLTTAFCKILPLGVFGIKLGELWVKPTKCLDFRAVLVCSLACTENGSCAGCGEYFLSIPAIDGVDLIVTQANYLREASPNESF
jgi:hypothetical protein